MYFFFCKLFNRDISFLLYSGTGALAIFMKKSFEVDITTSDLDDMEVEENISYNCEVNGLSILPHLRRKLCPIHAELIYYFLNWRSP